MIHETTKIKLLLGFIEQTITRIHYVEKSLKLERLFRMVVNSLTSSICSINLAVII